MDDVDEYDDDGAVAVAVAAAVAANAVVAAAAVVAAVKSSSDCAAVDVSADESNSVDDAVLYDASCLDGCFVEDLLVADASR